MQRTGSTFHALGLAQLLAVLAALLPGRAGAAEPPDARHAAARITPGRRVVGLASGSRAGVFARRNTPSLFYLRFTPIDAIVAFLATLTDRKRGL